MTSLKLDINVEQFQVSLLSKIMSPGTQTVPALIGSTTLEQLHKHLDEEAASRKIISFKADWYRPSHKLTSLSPSLMRLIEYPIIELGYYRITIVTNREDPCNFSLIPPANLQWIDTVNIKTQTLKTLCKHIIRLYSVGFKTDILLPLIQTLGPSCQCSIDYLVPHIEGVWDWELRFLCKICGKSYFCECFRQALEKYYPIALSKRSYYPNGGWPHKFIATFENSEFRERICHLCRDISSEILYCSPVYGSKVLVHYGPYIKRTSIEKGIDLREAENEIREVLGIPRIGEGWISEVELLNLVKDIFRGEEVIHQASPEWLGRQRLDIFIPNQKIAIEYQGRQHYEPVDFFGGNEAYIKTKERDTLKAQLCLINETKLIYFRYDEKISKQLVEARIKSLSDNTRKDD